MPFTLDLQTPITSLGRPAPAAVAAPDLRPQDGRSYLAGERGAAPWRKTVGAVLVETARRFPEREAAVFVAAGLRWRWRELLQRVDALAAGLLALGLGRGDRVGIWAPNRPEWLLLQFATARIGAILVTINPAYRTAELEHALNRSGCALLVTAAAFKSSDYLAMLRELAPELARQPAGAEPGRLRAARLPALRTLVATAEAPSPGILPFAALERLAGPAQRARLEAAAAALDPDDPINIQFTSGTTGAPKGATLSHYNIVNNARFTVARLGLGETDRLCLPVPLYHCFGMVMGTLGAAMAGATMVFPGEGFEAEACLRALAAERCSALYGVPTMFTALLEQQERLGLDLASLRTGIMAGAPCPVAVMRRVIEALHLPEITIAYGMTETSPVSFQSHRDDPLERRVGTVGRIHPNLEVKIVDPAGRTVPLGTPGELCTRGYSVMLGYWDEPEATRAVLDPAGWMHSGDLATLDREGYCNIVGRVKDMIIRGGENIYPREIEEFLLSHPAVAQAQVFGLPDPKYGEAVAAWILPRAGQRPSPEEILAFCRGRIAHYKLPQHLRLVEAFPLTATGKPQKFRMREAMMRELGLREERTA